MNTPEHTAGTLLSPPPCSATWPQGFSVTIGSRWQTKETPRLRGTLFAADVTKNSVSLQLEETEDFRGGLASKLAWVSTAQDFADKWECLPNDNIEIADSSPVPCSPSLDRLNAAQKAWDEFSGNRDEAEHVTRNLNDLRPRGYLAVHGDGSCRVMIGESCLTPLRAIPEVDAIQLALAERIQSDIRFRLSDRTWFASQQTTT